MKYHYNWQILILLFSLNVNVISQFSGNVDDKFKEARELAFDGQREESIILCKHILEYYPKYDDVRIFLSRIYLWEKEIDKARSELLNSNDIERESAVNLFLDIELQANNYEEVIEIANRGLKNSLNNEEYLYKKAVAQNKLGNTKGAGEGINRILNLNPSHKKAVSMRNLIELAGMNNSLSLNYNINKFDSNFDPWHLASVDISRKFEFGSLIFRANYASRFEKNGYQFETDGYIRFLDGMYSYINFGYSPSDLFPDFRFGIEPYFKLPFSMEISVGYRYLLFGDNGVNLYTGHLGKYIGNYWLSIRPFISPKAESTGFSGIFIIRRYFSDSDNFLSIQGGIGFAQSGELNDTEFLKLDSKKIGMEYQVALSKYLILKTALQYAYEEYYKDKWRNSYELKIGLKRRF